MFKRFIRPVAQDIFPNLSGAYLTLRGAESQHLMPRRLDGAGLMCGNVRRLRRKHALMRAQSGSYHSHVGLCAADEKMHVGIFIFALSFDLFACCGAVGVVSVSGGLLIICFVQAEHYLRQSALEIVAFKPNHAFLTSTLTFSPSEESLMRATFSPRRSIIFSAIASSTSFWMVRRRFLAP